MVTLLKKYLPDLMVGISTNTSFTNGLDNFKIRYQYLKVKLATEGDSEIKINSIYEWIVSAEGGNGQSVAFLGFVNSTVVNIRTRLDVTLEGKFNAIIKNFILSFDTDITLNNNPAYLNYLGELLIFDRMLSDPEKFKLSGIEVSLPNGKSADILMTPAGNEKKILFDIVSIHGFNPSIPKADKEVVDFFLPRYTKKLEAKTKNIPESKSGASIFIGNEEFQFAIAPILWNELSDLHTWSKVLTQKYHNVLPLSILYATQEKNGRYNFTFTTISEALKASSSSSGSLDRLRRFIARARRYMKI